VYCSIRYTQSETNFPNRFFSNNLVLNRAGGTLMMASGLGGVHPHVCASGSCGWGQNLCECLRVLRELVRFLLGFGIWGTESLAIACPAVRCPSTGIGAMVSDPTRMFEKLKVRLGVLIALIGLQLFGLWTLERWSSWKRHHPQGPETHTGRWSPSQVGGLIRVPPARSCNAGMAGLGWMDGWGLVRKTGFV